MTGPTIFCNGCQHHRALCMFPDPKRHVCTTCIEAAEKRAKGKVHTIQPAQERQRKRRYLAGSVPPFAKV